MHMIKHLGLRLHYYMEREVYQNQIVAFDSAERHQEHEEQFNQSFATFPEWEKSFATFLEWENIYFTDK